MTARTWNRAGGDYRRRGLPEGYFILRRMEFVAES
jgi:hypothetical protein